MDKRTCSIMALALALTMPFCLPAYAGHPSYADLGPQTPDPTRNQAKKAYAYLVDTPPIVDGDLSDWLLLIPLVLDRDSADEIRGLVPDYLDSSVRLWATWDTAGLYFALHVCDNTLINDSPLVWWDDEIELSLDADLDGMAGRPDDHQYTINEDGRVTDFGLDPASISVATRRVSDGWDVEVMIPAAELLGRAEPLTERTMGFSLGLHDDDDGGYYDSYMIWAGTETWNVAEGGLMLWPLTQQGLIRQHLPLVEAS